VKQTLKYDRLCGKDWGLLPSIGITFEGTPALRELVYTIGN